MGGSQLSGELAGSVDRESPEELAGVPKEENGSIGRRGCAKAVISSEMVARSSVSAKSYPRKMLLGLFSECFAYDLLNSRRDRGHHFTQRFGCLRDMLHRDLEH